MKMFGKKIFLLSLLIASQFQLLVAATTVNMAKGAISFKEIGDNYLSSFGIVESHKPTESNESENKKVKLTSPNLSEQEKRQIVFELMAATEKPAESNPLIANAMRVTLADIDAFYGNGKSAQETLMHEINNTITAFGDAELAYLLAHQVKDLNQLKARQALVKMFVECPEFADRIEEILNNIKKAESGFLSYWRTNDPLSEKLFKELYFSKPMLKKYNGDKVALEALTRWGNLGTFGRLTGDLALFLGFNYVTIKMGEQVAKRMDFKDPTGKSIVVDTSLKAVAKSTYDSLKSYLNPYDYYQQIKNVKPAIEQASRITELQGNPPLTEGMKSGLAKVSYGIIGAKGAIVLGVLSYKYFTAKKALEQAAQTKNSINYLQSKLIDVAAIVDACKLIHELAQSQPMLAEGVLQIDALGQLLNGNGNNKFKELVDLLQKSTFKGQPSFFSLSGRVLAAHQLMIEEKNQFAPALQALGELDACLSMAKLYNKMKAERVNYCFVNFVKKETPYIKVVNFWNPFVNKNTVVTNSLELGHGTDASKIILTGSNTGGKSTILKALMIDLLMAGSFGIAPAQELTMTHFEFIGSYLRVNDDTASGESKFKAEVLRAKMLTETMASLKKNEFGFVVIDELFTGTNSVNAAEAAIKVAKNLASLENNLYILATHFPVLTELEKTHEGVIKNYKVDIYKDEAGNLVRPFKIEPGISDSNVANDILNEQIQSIHFGN